MWRNLDSALGFGPSGCGFKSRHARFGDCMIKLVIFDQDGVLVTPKSTWRLVKEQNDVDDLFAVKSLLRLNPKEEHGIELGLLTGLPKSVFEEVARTVPLEPHVEETINALFDMGIEVHIVTLAPDVIARGVAARVNEKFEKDNFIRVHAPIALFNTDDKLVGILAFPNKAFKHALHILDGNEMDKVKVIKRIISRLHVRKDEVLFVGDGYDVEVAKAFPTIAYKSEDPNFYSHAIKRANDLSEVVEYVKQVNFSSNREKQKLL